MRSFAALAISGALLAQAPQARDVRAPLLAEIARVRSDVTRLVPADQREAATARLTRADGAARDGRLFLALYDLEPAWEAADTARFVHAHEDVKTTDAFTRLWTTTGEPRPAAGARVHAPIVVEALAEAADARGPATYRASLPYASDAGVAAGLYYLGDAHAAVHFAAFARALQWPGADAAPPLRSIAPEIDALDRDVTSAYERMDRSQHAAYIQTSDAIKEARTLDGNHQYAGALLKYLVARYRFALLRGDSEIAPAAALADARRALPASRDNSVAQLFIEMAETALDDSSPATHAVAAVVVRDVLPAYADATAVSTATTTSSAPAPVTITLVRWPFT